MIGGGSHFPSATTEREKIKSSDEKLNTCRSETNQTERTSETILPIHPQRREEKQITFRLKPKKQPIKTNASDRNSKSRLNIFPQRRER